MQGPLLVQQLSGGERNGSRVLSKVDMRMRGRMHVRGNQKQLLHSGRNDPERLKLRLESVDTQALIYHLEAKLCRGSPKSGKVEADFARHAFIHIALPRALISKRKRHCAPRRKTVGVKCFSCPSK